MLTPILPLLNPRGPPLISSMAKDGVPSSPSEKIVDAQLLPREKEGGLSAIRDFAAFLSEVYLSERRTLIIDAPSSDHVPLRRLRLLDQCHWPPTDALLLFRLQPLNWWRGKCNLIASSVPRVASTDLAVEKAFMRRQRQCRPNLQQDACLLAPTHSPISRLLVVDCSAYPAFTRCARCRCWCNHASG
jgi:hypothetical protein